MRLCVSCEFVKLNIQEVRSFFFFGQKTEIHHPSVCLHPNFVDPVTGTPKYTCSILRDSNMPCGPRASLYQPSGKPDIDQ